MAVKRVLALLLAIAMVVGAQTVRERIDEGQAVDGPDRPDPDVADVAIRLTCDPVLEGVCAAIAEETDVDAVTLPPGDVADRLADPAAEAPRGAWVTLAPWVELAALRRESAGETPVLGEAAGLARSPLVAAVWEDRAAALADHCGALSWRCVGEVASGTWADIGAPDAWGPVKLGRPDTIGTADGLTVLGQLAAGYFGDADLTRSEVEDNAFFAWFSELEDARPTLPPGAASPIEAMILFGQATLDIAGVLEAQAAPLLASAAARAGTLRLRVIEPLATADLVVVAIGDDGEAQDLAGDVARLAPALLAEAGWRVEGEPDAPALEQVGVDLPDGLPPAAGLPPAGVLLALQQLAQEVGP